MVVALVAAACGDDDATTTTQAPGTTQAPTTTAGGGEDTTTTEAPMEGLESFGESTDADEALVLKALGTTEGVPDIVLASIARAGQDLDDATIAKALECFNATECDTGSGGDLVMGFADGGGLNVWRKVTKMEAILQALTYPQIGTIVIREANWDPNPEVAKGDLRFMLQRGVDFVLGYPDNGVGLAEELIALDEAGIPFFSYSGGWVGLPGQEGALVPGEDYAAIVGEDLCALGESFASILNEHLGEGTIGVLGGTPGNALSAGWQQCEIDALNDGIELVGPPADTYWVNSFAYDAVSAWLQINPNIVGFSYEYADGLNTALAAFDDVLGTPVEGLDELIITVRTDEQTLFCDWVERDNPNYRIFYSAGGNFQSRVAVTTAMLYLQGYEFDPVIVVPHVMREITAADCDLDRVTPDVSGTSLVPDELLALMFAGA
jgi:ABC-type sugar transport system substrate-binding protein